MPSAKFNEVYAKTREIKSGPSNDEQLKLYAYAKVANKADINAADKPGMFDMKGKAMRKAWQEQVDAGLTAEEAEQKYIELGEKLIKEHL